MRTLMGLVVAGGLVFGMAGESKAQFSLAIGNPYVGQGYGSNLGGYGPGYGAYNGGLGYSSGYSGYGNGLGYANTYNSYQSTGYLAGPGVIGAQNFGYSSGYGGYVAPVAPVYGYGSTYIANPLTGYQTNRYYGAYGYGNYSYGSRDGFRPFRPMGRFFR